jgi:molecular chaperone DnaK
MAADRRILCVDFGTSSIRAAVRIPGNVDAKVLELGESFNSSIDKASIPSAIFIPTDRTEVAFGESALQRSLSGERAALFEMSPKRWLTGGSPDELKLEALHGLGLSRRDLLIGLVAQAFSAICGPGGLSRAQLEKADVRIAHPVWPRNHERALRLHLSTVSATAREIAGMTNHRVSPKRLRTAIDKASPSWENKDFDVVEPVAAAVQLFEDSENARELCFVIDVGAGTTDLALFLSLTPDARGFRRKLIQIASPRSIYMAGDLIDEQVIELIASRARLSKDRLQALRVRKRQIKEALFGRTKKVFEAGVEVALEDLTEQSAIQRMCQALSREFNALIDEGSSFIERFARFPLHPANTLNVVFAGGGSKIDFLHDAVNEPVRLPSGFGIPVVLSSAIDGGRPLPAALDRLAVALGGTTREQHWPVTSIKHVDDLVTRWDRGEFSAPS